MVPEPLRELTLVAASVADDLGFVALADISAVLDHSPRPSYRIIGGHMMTALVGRWDLGAWLYRVTEDTDLGVPPIVIRDLDLVGRFLGLGYQKVSGARFARQVVDVPVSVAGELEGVRAATVDVLIPANSSRARQNRRVGDSLVTTEVPGLGTALLRPAADMTLHLRRLDGSVLNASLLIADEPSAVILKALVRTTRNKDTDVVDLWRALEICFNAGVEPDQFDTIDGERAVDIAWTLFAHRDGDGMKILIENQHLTSVAADQLHTRIRALIARVLGRS